MVQDTRKLNRNSVLTELLLSRPSTRTQLAAATGISPATVTRVVDALLADGILVEGEEIVATNRGRRARSVDLIPDQQFVLGIDLGATNTRILLTDLLAQPLLARELPTPTMLSAAELARWVESELRSTAGDNRESIGQICLGLPGAVSQQHGTVSNAPNLPQVEDPEFLRELQSRLNRPFSIDNDANYALLGEQRFGAALEQPTAAMLTLGSGVGTGLAVDGHILQGRLGLVGEFGQLPAGPLGSRLEHMVTGPGILRRAAESSIKLSSPAELFAEDAGPEIQSLRTQFDQALLIVLTAIVVASEPSTIVLGGGISKSLIPSLAQFENALQRTLRYTPKLVPPALGDFSGAVGAAVAGLQAAYLILGVNAQVLRELPRSGALDLASITAVRD